MVDLCCVNWEGVSFPGLYKAIIERMLLLDSTKKSTVSTLVLVGGFSYFLFSPLLGEMIQFDWYFSKGLKPLTSFGFSLKNTPWSFIWFTWKWHPGISEIPALETIIFRFYVELWGCTFRKSTPFSPKMSLVKIPTRSTPKKCHNPHVCKVLDDLDD